MNIDRKGFLSLGGPDTARRLRASASWLVVEVPKAQEAKPGAMLKLV